MKIKLGNHQGQYNADQAGATYILKAGAIISNENGRAIYGEDDAAGKRFIINGTVSGDSTGLTTGNSMLLNHAQNIVIGKSGIVDADDSHAIGIYGDNSKLVNRGVVKSAGDNGVGIDTNGQDVNVTNSGTVIGKNAIRLGGDDTVVTNTGKRIVDAIVDLPFALPTAVAGIALASLYANNGWVGGSINWLLGLVGLPGIKIAYSPLGIVVALTFIGLPFVVRTVQPVIEEIDREVEEAAATLGASRLQAIFRVIVPSLVPAILTGFALAFARAAGEYGSVIFIAGNIPYVSEIAPLLIIIKLEEFNYAGATAIGTLMLLVAFIMLFVINLIQAWTRRYANVA